jgi:hypothetical protein
MDLVFIFVFHVLFHSRLPVFIMTSSYSHLLTLLHCYFLRLCLHDVNIGLAAALRRSSHEREVSIFLLIRLPQYISNKLSGEKGKPGGDR